MSLSAITIGTNAITVVGLPSTPGFRSIEFSMEDTVAAVRSPFTGQTQTQAWPGADWWTATVTLPPLSQAQEGPWKAFLGAMRGMQNGVLIGMDPSHVQSSQSGLWQAKANDQTGGYNLPGSALLYVDNLPQNLVGIYQPGDYLQVGYRLHMVVDAVDTDNLGVAAVPIWPSLREMPTNQQNVITVNPRGLFRLAQNKRGWSADYTRLSSVSIQLTEYR